MSDSLVLFCGGPAIYAGATKPLQTLSTGETLLELYLRHVEPSVPKEVILLVESAFEADYQAVIESLSYSAEVKIFTCLNNSTTLSMLQEFLKSGYPAENVVMFSYPDVFVYGDIVTPADADSRFTDSVFISFTPVFSRFPRLVVDPYDSTVLGISNHTSPMPANPLHIFGGHLLVRAGLMKTLVDTFVAERGQTPALLEFDMFYWLINASRLQGMPIYGRRMQADSQREIAAIVSQARFQPG